MGSLSSNNIGDAGARDLGAALQVNTTLTTLEWGWNLNVMRFEAVWGCQKGSPNDLGQCSHLHMGSLRGNKIGDAGGRGLGAALRVNTTLTTLQWGWDMDVDAIWGGVGVLQLRWQR
jgi:hypothetical protein